MALQGHAIGELGGAADAQVLLQRASTLALEVARTYCGPWCLGIQALHTPNVERARELLAQGEALLAERLRQPQPPGVPPRGDGVLRCGTATSARRAGTRRRSRPTREDEPLAWSSLVIARAEYLADRAEDPARADLAGAPRGAAARHPGRRLRLAAPRSLNGAPSPLFSPGRRFPRPRGPRSRFAASIRGWPPSPRRRALPGPPWPACAGPACRVASRS